MISAATFRAAAPTVSIELQTMPPSQQFSVGQVVKAQVLERLSAEKSLISIGGVQMQAATEIAVVPGDILYFTVRSAEPLVLQLHGMEYRSINPFSTAESVVRLLNLTSDRLTIGVLSYMTTRNRKISKSEVEENRRMLTTLRSEGMHQESDEELLDLIYDLRSKRLPLTSAHILLARKRAASGDIGELSRALLEMIESLPPSESIPERIKDPIVAYFRKQRSAAEAIRSAVETLGIDYEHSLIAWGVGSKESAKTTSLKAALMDLVLYIDGEGERAQARAALRATASRLIDVIEAQQFDLLGPADNPHAIALQIPVPIDGMLHTLRLSIMEHGEQGMFQDAPREYSFHLSIDLSELGTVSASGRLAGRQLAIAFTADDEAHARALDEEMARLEDALRTDGCLPVSLTARAGAPGMPLRRKAVDASA